MLVHCKRIGRYAIYEQGDSSRLNLANDQAFPRFSAFSNDIGGIPAYKLVVLQLDGR